MELNAKTLQEVTFGAKVRGYDPAEVDDFIAAVAEGVEELHERLRRATERATRAEQELAAIQDGGAPVPQVETAVPSASPEISKVWERAVAAAEQAMEEAKAEAQKLLDGSRTQADTQLSDARREAETTVSTAKAEAARITEESQADLRIQIQKLESARDALNADVAGLSSFLESEKERIKARLNEALGAIEQYGSGANPFTEPAASTFVSDAMPAATSSATAATDEWSAPTSTATTVEQPEWNGHTDSGSGSNDWQDEESVTSSQPEGQSDSNEHQNEEEEVGSENWDAGERSEYQDQASASQGEGENDGDEADPFLAELRRAVQDDGPLGPREEGFEGSLEEYASDDESNGFFRRNK